MFHTDGLGSVRALTDGSGTVTQTFQTNEFGIPTLTQGTNTEPFRYTGQQRDAETGFYDLRARYYWPSIGRFVTRDPNLGDSMRPCTLNRDDYAFDNPLSYTDPSGLDPTDHLCTGEFRTAAGTVVFGQSPFGRPLEPGRLGWSLYISYVAREALGIDNDVYARVDLIVTLVNGRPNWSCVSFARSERSKLMR